MFEIRICGLKELHTHKEWATHVITLVDSRDLVPQVSVPQHVEIFGDVETDNFHLFQVPLAKISQVKRIFEFVQALPKDARLLIHCHAGIGRSTATAIGILCAQGLTPEQAIEQVEQIRPQMWPNEWVAGLWGRVLEIEHIPEKIAEWKNQAAKTGLIWPEQ